MCTCEQSTPSEVARTICIKQKLRSGARLAIRLTEPLPINCGGVSFVTCSTQVFVWVVPARGAMLLPQLLVLCSSAERGAGAACARNTSHTSKVKAGRHCKKSTRAKAHQFR